MYDVITIGSATVDVFVKTEADLIEIKKGCEQENLIAYPSGSKILISDLKFEIGGGGTNTAVSFSRLGLNTAFLGVVGCDTNSDNIINLLKKEKVEFIGKRIKGQTGYSVILDSQDDDRTILTYKGVNSRLSYGIIDKKKINAKWLYISSMVGDSFAATEKLSAYAKKKNIKVAFNPSSYLAKQGILKLKKIISNTDFLVLNREESELILGQNDIKTLLRAFNKLGPKITIITAGKNGIYANDSRHLYHLGARKVKVKETTGAGDSFASGFVAGLILKGDVPFSMRLGMANANSVICHIGAKNKLLTFDEAKKEIKKVPRIHILK